jgi:hypothetical protein
MKKKIIKLQIYLWLLVAKVTLEEVFLNLLVALSISHLVSSTKSARVYTKFFKYIAQEYLVSFKHVILLKYPYSSFYSYIIMFDKLSMKIELEVQNFPVSLPYDPTKKFQ